MSELFVLAVIVVVVFGMLGTMALQQAFSGKSNANMRTGIDLTKNGVSAELEVSSQSSISTEVPKTIEHTSNERVGVDRGSSPENAKQTKVTRVQI